MTHKKPHLPQKTCATCGRPFAWRKKWARVWDEVRHCSDACRKARKPRPSTVNPSAVTPPTVRPS